MRVVVVGATGNVGTSVVSALAADESVDSVLGLARRPGGPAHPKVRWERADVRLTDLAPAFAGADAVIHLAWLLQPSHQEPRMRAVNVDGSARVFAAAADAGVKTLIYASSVGAYAAAPPGDRPLGEEWPATGIPSAYYARHKARVEALLDRHEAEHPEMRVVRLRPALIFKREAATEIKRYFVGPLVPPWAIRPGALPAIPWPAGLRFQAVHTSDIAQAYRLAVTKDAARGAYNIAAEPVIGPSEFGGIVNARIVEVPPGLVRKTLDLSWRARLQATEPGWLDMALGVPVMDTSRARNELGWSPQVSAVDALAELLSGIPVRSTGDTPVLAAS
jgi:nucleoside-diphosphate-sugar epimerase